MGKSSKLTLVSNFLKFKTFERKIDARKLNEAHYHREAKFRPLRLAGVACISVALLLSVVAASTNSWSYGEDYTSGLWDSCFRKNGTNFQQIDACTTPLDSWQKAVIGLFIFAVSFGFLATILSMCGICVNNLPRKLYYYHSAGEIFFVCALSCTFSLVAYPIMVEKENLPKHNYGYSYMLAWTATAFFYAACFCMMLDDVVHAFSTRGCLCCCKKGKPNDGSQSV